MIDPDYGIDDIIDDAWYTLCVEKDRVGAVAIMSKASPEELYNHDRELYQYLTKQLTNPFFLIFEMERLKKQKLHLLALCQNYLFRGMGRSDEMHKFNARLNDCLERISDIEEMALKGRVYKADDYSL